MEELNARLNILSFLVDAIIEDSSIFVEELALIRKDLEAINRNSFDDDPGIDEKIGDMFDEIQFIRNTDKFDQHKLQFNRFRKSVLSQAELL